MSFDKVMLLNDRFKVVENERGWARVKPVREFVGSAVFPVMPNGDILLVQESRETLTGPQLQWNIPRGGAEDGETPLDTAMREFEEETALRVPAERFVFLANLCPDNGLLLHKIPVFAVVLHGLELAPLADKSEIHAIRAFSPSAVAKMALAGELPDMFTLAAMSLWDGFCKANRVTSSGTHNMSMSVTQKHSPMMYSLITEHKEALTAAGWSVWVSEGQIRFGATWLPGREPKLPNLPEDKLGAYRPLLESFLPS